MAKAQLSLIVELSRILTISWYSDNLTNSTNLVELVQLQNWIIWTFEVNLKSLPGVVNLVKYQFESNLVELL